jgi:hypothetical protein
MTDQQWPHEDTSALDAFYGDPRGHDGRESPAWAAQNLVKWVPPYPLFYSDDKHSPLLHLWVHKKCLAAFNAAFKEVLTVLGIEYIKAHRLNICGGTFCFRVQRGGSRLSVHAYGCAIDMDPGHNPFPHKWAPGSGMIDGRFAAILQKHGFCWRGADGDDDAMHFQLCHH